MSTLVLRVLLPALLFIPLALIGRHFVMGHIGVSGGAAFLFNQCPPNSGPYCVRYVGLGPIDDALCFLVAFYQASFDPTGIHLTADFLASLSGPIALTFVEAARSGRSIILAFPAIMGVVYMIDCAAFTFPFFWIALILFGHTRLDRAAARIDQARAEAARFAVLAGYVVPTMIMLTLQLPYIAAYWSLFPVWMGLGHAAHLFIRPSSRYNTSGYWTIQTTFIVTFITSAIYHVSAIWSVKDLASLRDLYVPPIVAPDPSIITLPLAVHVLLKWDALVALGSNLLGTLWFARNAEQVVLIAVWNVIASVVVGPGAAVSGVLLWREWTLNGEREEVSKKKW
ncbi:hypothetical protein F5888DRAFT_1800037 [Russula emetica]|nr:hypothetical protein F5888DRAFT_1800037 [Russula emetica]